MAGSKSTKRHHERNIGSYDRKAGKHPPNKSILIVCEGKETEPNYFTALRNYLRLSTVEVMVINDGGAPISIVNMATRLVNRRKKEVRKKEKQSQIDIVWCVFDCENPNLNTTLNVAVNKADSLNYRLAVSNPAFEFWYILHFINTTRPFNNGKEVKEFLKIYIPNYCESLPVFTQILINVNTAINNSTQSLKNHPDGNNRFPNPSTFVHLLVVELLEMSIVGKTLLQKE
jgi:hypothetical protein